MDVLYCDNHLLVINKPPGMATQPDLHVMAKSYLKNRFKKPGNVFLEPIHRLDKPVSGIVVFARTSKALSRLNEQMRQREIQKYYLARVEGKIEGDGTLEHLLEHGSFKAFVSKKGKPAKLTYTTLKSDISKTLVEVSLQTGRYHQIRAQFAAEGHPICGDHKYGSKENREAIMLHHARCIFKHPTTKEILTFQSQAGFSF